MSQRRTDLDRLVPEDPGNPDSKLITLNAFRSRQSRKKRKLVPANPDDPHSELITASAFYAREKRKKAKKEGVKVRAQDGTIPSDPENTDSELIRPETYYRRDYRLRKKQAENLVTSTISIPKSNPRKEMLKKSINKSNKTSKSKPKQEVQKIHHSHDQHQVKSKPKSKPNTVLCNEKVKKESSNPQNKRMTKRNHANHMQNKPSKKIKTHQEILIDDQIKSEPQSSNQYHPKAPIFKKLKHITLFFKPEEPCQNQPECKQVTLGSHELQRASLFFQSCSLTQELGRVYFKTTFSQRTEKYFFDNGGEVGSKEIIFHKNGKHFIKTKNKFTEVFSFEADYFKNYYPYTGKGSK